MQLINELEERPIRRDPRAVALMLVASLTVMTAATISPALPGLETQFSGDETYGFLIRLLVPAPSLAVVLVAPWCGVIADRSSRRSMLLAGLVLFIISGSAGLFLPTLPLIMASRLCLGIALAMIMTAQSALLGDYFSGKTLHVVSSAQVSARNLGGFVFIVIAGLLATIGPRFPFAVYALPALALPFFWRVIVDPPSSMAAGQNTAFTPGKTQPLIYLLAFGQMVVTMLFFVMPTQLPFFLSGQGYSSPAVTGGALGTLMLAGGGAALYYPRLREAIGYAGNWACGFGLMAMGFATLVTVEAGAAVFFGCAAIGAGYALAIPGFVAISLSATSSNSRGKTGALLTGSVFLGQFLSPLISTPAISAWGWRASGIGLAVVLGVLALISGLAFQRSRRVALGKN
jgi:MFS family permease